MSVYLPFPASDTGGVAYPISYKVRHNGPVHDDGIRNQKSYVDFTITLTSGPISGGGTIQGELSMRTSEFYPTSDTFEPYTQYSPIDVQFGYQAVNGPAYDAVHEGVRVMRVPDGAAGAAGTISGSWMRNPDVNQDPFWIGSKFQVSVGAGFQGLLFGETNHSGGYYLGKILQDPGEDPDPGDGDGDPDPDPDPDPVDGGGVAIMHHCNFTGPGFVPTSTDETSARETTGGTDADVGVVPSDLSILPPDPVSIRDIRTMP